VDAVWLSAEEHGDSVVVGIRGDLDIVTSPQLDECLTQAEASHSRIILDLSGVDFLDTSALAVIVGHWKKAEAAGGLLALAGARYRYTKTLWITGLADRLAMYDDVDKALLAEAKAATGPRASEPEASEPEPEAKAASGPEAKAASEPEAKAASGPEAAS
jgi:anti-sigma B factor antagonist